jgi:uncharacterized protein YqeY
MSIKEQINDAVKQALKDKDETRKTTLRGVLASIKQVEIDQRVELDDSGVMGVLQKEVKMRHESIADSEKAGRDDLIKEANAQLAILEEFLPKGLSDEELKAVVKETIAEVGAQSIADMGKVMGAIMPKVKGRADGGKVNQMVKDALQG